MKDLSGHIKYCIIALACVLTLGSCIFDDYPDNGQSAGGTEDPDQAFLVLHISPVNTTRAQDNNGIAEKIKSLRIIMLNKVGDETTIECNERMNYTDDRLADGFTQAFTRKTDQGKKKFYFIANEDEVTGIVGNTNNTSMKDLLDAYQAGDGASAFETWINSVYFEPAYTINEKNEIYLPYTAFYEGTEVKKTSDDKWENLIQPDMYLVPVATKFFFKFTNNREDDIEIQNLKIGGDVVRKDGTTGGIDFVLDENKEEVMIGGLNKANYLMANINSKSSDYNKVFADDGKSYYWIDWLEKVSALSSGGSFNNNRYGWISDYGMPKQNDAETWVLVDKDADKGKYPIVLGTTSRPDDEEKSKAENEKERTIVIGPYYMPESKYEVTYEEEVTENGKTTKKEITEQKYILNLYLHDTRSTAGALDFEFAQQMDEVKALFRNTYVIIIVTMSGQVDVDIYAEIKGWKYEEASGWAAGGSLM